MNLLVRFWTVALLLIASAPAFAQKGEFDRRIRVEITPKDKAQFIEILKSNMDIPHGHGDHLDALITQPELTKLLADGAHVEVINPDVYDGTEGGDWLPEYLSFSEVETQLNQLATDYPDLTELTVIGTSIEGRNIYALKISDNAASDEPESEILLIGNHHAREVITPIICMHVAEELLNGYGTNATYTDWVDNREIWIVPVLNPDGYVYVETTNLFWRKNRRNNPGGNEGVDLNRNWGYEWGHDDVGSSGNFGSGVYRGTAPFSEPETEALRQFVLTREFKVAMSFHSFSNLLLWGPGYKPGDSSDQDIFAGFGEVVTAQNNYTVGNQAVGTIYIVNGECTDWLYNVAGIIAFTPEVGDSSDYFNPPANRIPGLIQEGGVCAWAAIEFGDRPGQLAPPGPPLPNSIPANSGDYSVTWSAPVVADTEVVAYELVEKTGPTDVVDGAENGDMSFDLNGWVVSNVRSSDGSFSFYAGDSGNANQICYTNEGYVVQPGDTFTFDAYYDLENEYDFLYAVVSTDGGRSYESLEGSFTTMNDPTGRNSDNGITGTSNGWQQMTFDLSDFAGQTVRLGFRCSTDGGGLGEGIFIDNVSPVPTFATSTVVDSGINDTQFAFTNKPDGTYYYTLRGLDAEGNWGYPSDYTSVLVGDQFVALPANFLVTRGLFVSGTNEDIQTADNNDLRISRSITDIQARTEFEVGSTSPIPNPDSMKVILEGSVFARSSVNQTVELFNYTSGQWEIIDSRSATRFFDVSISIDVTGDVSRFIEPGTAAIKARVNFQSPAQRLVFGSNTDQLVWVLELD